MHEEAEYRFVISGETLKFEYLIECTLNVSPLRLKYVISSCGSFNYLLKHIFYKFSGIYIGNLHCGQSLIDVIMTATLWLYLRFFQMYNSSLKMSFSLQAMNLNYVEGPCNLKARTCFQKTSLDQVDQILTNFIYEKDIPM